MDSLGFRVEMRPHAPGYEAPWVRHDDGRQRRASDEELALWRLCEELARRATEAEAEQPRRRK